MAVPNTTTFTLDDVRLEVDPTKNNLNDLITVANAQSPSEWDSDYEGSKNSLLNFRNYGAEPTFTAFTMTTQKYFQTSNINCSDTTYTTYYHDGTSSEPKLGDTIYEDSLGETPHNGLFFGNDAWRVLSSSRTSVAVSSNGVVTDTSFICAP